MEQFVTKSVFKAKALEYLREVESTGKELLITDHGKPVLKVVPYAHDFAEALKTLRGSVLRYDDPLEPVGLKG
jgi:prevent-host-death family protein